MSRGATRARRRRAHKEFLEADFQRNRDDPEAFPETLARIAASPLSRLANRPVGSRWSSPR